MLSEQEKQRAAAIHKETQKLAQRLERRGYQPSEILCHIASAAIGAGAACDGLRVWAVALRDHADRLERVAERLEREAALSVHHH